MKLRDSLEGKLDEYVFQLLLKGCTIEAKSSIEEKLNDYVFQLLLKGCTIEACYADNYHTSRQVSVVVKRMYD